MLGHEEAIMQSQAELQHGARPQHSMARHGYSRQPSPSPEPFTTGVSGQGSGALWALRVLRFAQRAVNTQ